MRFDILTLFPAMVESVLSESIIGRAQKNGILEVHAHNIRDYSENKHRRVDDTPYGGGRGMLMAAPPVWNCWQAVQADMTAEEQVRTIYLSPRGKTFTQKDAQRLAGYDRLILLCGHYEGIDQRAVDAVADEEISIGDYVLTGGELPACILADSVGRLIDGVLPEAECHEKESFEKELLEYPQYTRPEVFRGERVPDVLLSGHHENIDKWRLEQAEEATRQRRPDLYEKYLQKYKQEKNIKRTERKLSPPR
ncbi:MAG: tRNA (guanosine(37)-N1)-methyltransferase TrmD [Clostridiales bacterium]|jgi:tRNA (guanine37-N1)-methyltransferase|nr:tRNA (guanosine(37)-N1)-methyltransferase TrmD [Clostridiales bacterium]